MTSHRDKARRRWQFSLRELLLLAVIVALLAGWWVDRQQLLDERYDLESENHRLVDVIKVTRSALAEAGIRWEYDVASKNVILTVDNEYSLRQLLEAPADAFVPPRDGPLRSVSLVP